MINFTKINKTYNYIIRIGILIIAYWFIYRQIFFKNNSTDIINSFLDLFTSADLIFYSVIVMILMFVNLAIESAKWQFLISKIEKVSYYRSFKAVLTGITVSIFTPNRVGDYLGRVFILNKASHWKGILITIIGHMSLLLVIIIFGSISILILIPQYKEISTNNSYILDNLINYGYWGLFSVLIIINIVGLILYFNISFFATFINRFIKKEWKNIRSIMLIFSYYSRKELLKVFFYSFTRFLVFSFQLFMLLRLFDVKIPYPEAMVAISVMYFVITAIPTIALAEVGIRGSIAIFTIGLYFEKYNNLTDQITIGIISSTSILWFINLIIPALIGTIFVFHLKFFRKKG